MKNQTISFEQTQRFSQLFKDYINSPTHFSEHISYLPNHEGLLDACAAYQNFEHRTTLNKCIETQYSKTITSDIVKKNIALLKDKNTFTITTGHQLSLFTGPLFFIFKIVSTIKLCQQLTQKHPDKNFIPVYWMASEDHDFEEINHTWIFGKKTEWKSTQTGPVGKFSLEGIDEVINELSEDLHFLHKFYLPHLTLAEATKNLVNELFQEYGLVIIEPDDQNLKEIFSPIMKQELVNPFTKKAMELTTNLLTKKGFKAQLSPREINLFYLQNGLRERIILDKNRYTVLNTDISFSKENLLTELENHPERFSPNAALRPVYQQTILPNIAYIGGPGELAYWFQLKEVFMQSKQIMPVVLPRNCGLVINAGILKKINKANLNILDLFQKKEIITKEESSTNETINIEEEIIQISKNLECKINNVVDHVPSLSGYAFSEYKKIDKQLNNILGRFRSGLQKSNEDKIIQIEGVLDKLFPSEGLQERKENVFSFSLNNKNFIPEIIEHFEPLKFEFNILTDE